MLVLSAFFSGMEIAFVSANKIHIEIEKKQNSFLATILKRLTKRPSKFIATMLVGNNIALVIYGFMMGDLLSHMLFSQYLAFSVLPIKILLLQTIISTLVILLTAEFLPKVFFQVYANSLLKFFAIPAYIFYVTFSFISEFIIWISDVILKKIFKTQGDSLQLSFSKVELGNYISEQMESVREEDTVDSEIQIFQNALDFSEVKAREVMIPRTEIVAVDINTTPKDLVKLFSETGYSKILVYKENIDDIIGYVHAFELFKKPESLKEILIPVVFVPETMLVKDSLNILIKKRESIAIILDEYGGTSGMMTIEDIIEELFGEIEDEHDITELIEEKFSDTLYKFSARLEVDYLNENYKLNLPENENYETLGGMIVYFAEEIPNKNEIVEIEQFNFKILEVSNTKIELVELEITSEK
ncbi:MAG: hemolysin [Flavobacteriaceae bacterium CG_4_8_14_3_um_filter_34_10]|nr:MAG: hemolysin [Flavobacteriaceae bacterium CG18_big_fil_WC_8_21_14_2_50_34_36]PIV51639.1 MAG: hemolysin [Flavobacteriaceae bacterium CG02_land_8_20_14_3_00_34_13]PIX10663.1 MAG: hemolysin [Flavobacteriaceae bacterium CG_4_8_14_3_um_filter_34_10]PIZ07939.1 MAG: hemolysin [Flavobacteriaceae bacterium CG_4_10_14_0_8_um_filter_34_31]PJC07258.1 MAG: hemolysin [Flavobacteriaceae bacterium CG_4_9_14_0_8_um_filter_34_30]